MDLPCTCQVDPVRQSPRTRMYGYFTHGTDPPPRPCSSGFLSLPNRLRRLPSPAHFRRQLPGHAAFTALVVLHSRPSTDRASLAPSLSLIGLLTPVPPGDPASPPEVMHCSSVPCHPQTPCYSGRMRAPSPHIRRLDLSRLWPTGSSSESPPRLRPGTSPHALRIPPRDGHPALRYYGAVATGPPWLYPAFAFVPV